MAHGGARPGSGPKFFSPSSAKLRQKLVKRVEELMDVGQGPFDVVTEIMLDKKEPSNVRIAAANLLVSHALPKQKEVAVEHVDDRSSLSIQQLDQLVDRRMEQLQDLRAKSPALIEGRAEKVKNDS